MLQRDKEMNIVKLLHIKGIKNTLCLFLVNKVFQGTNPYFFETKRKLLNAAGHCIGFGTKIVGPVEWHGRMEIGEDCWIGKNCRINGDGGRYRQSVRSWPGGYLSNWGP